MINDILKLIRFDKPIGTLLLLWPTLWALWIASSGNPSIDILIKMIIGTFVLRSAGCVINDIFDRDIDRHVERTKNRPITSGKISLKFGLFLFLLLMVVGASIAWSLGLAVFRMAIIGAFFVIIYPLAKRYISAPQAVLGLAFSWGVPMSFAIYSTVIPMQAWVLFFITMVWVVAYDTEYALVDLQDDLKLGINSTAILFGKHSTNIVAILLSIVLIALALFGLIYGYGIWYFFSIVIASLLFIFQIRLIRRNEPINCFRAFNNNGVVGAVIWLGLVLETSLFCQPV